MLGGLLTVDEGEFPLSELMDQGHEGGLGSVGHEVEHGFAEKDPAKGHAVEPTHQFAALPGFDAVGVSQFVEGMVGLGHFIHDPGAVLFRPGTIRAEAHHLGEGRVQGEGEGASVEHPFEGARYVQVFGQ